MFTNNSFDTITLKHMSLFNQRQDDWSLNQSFSYPQNISQNVMIKYKFPSQFRRQMWREIRKISCRQFISQQMHLVKSMLNDQQLFKRHFRQFHNNHLILYEWYVLASQKQQQMREYIFSQLLKKPFEQYRLILKQKLASNNINKLNRNSSKRQSPQVMSISKLFNRSNNAGSYKNNNVVSNNNTISNNNTSTNNNTGNNNNTDNNNNTGSNNNTANSSNKNSPIKSRSAPKSSKILLLSHQKKIQTAPGSIHHQGLLNLNSSQGQQREYDYHQLFVKTLDACDGSKYIYYDFCKHMKGYESRNTYNKFIRAGKSKYTPKLSGQKGKSIYKKNNSIHFENKSTYESLGNIVNPSNQYNKKSTDDNNTFSILKQKQNTIHHSYYNHKYNYSKFQITAIENDDDQNQMRRASDFEERKKKLLRSRTSKNIVLKKMPHMFGRQKPLTPFLLKDHKSPENNIRT